jgi:CheY-like chemotaxis protein
LARILLIDDDRAIRTVVRRMLEGARHEVLEASEGEAGMRLLAEHRPDLVITDLFMPGQDGIVTVRRIRKEFPGVKVIVVSGGDSTGRLDLRREAEVLGAIASLRKPFAAADLLRVIRETLALPDK